MKLFARGVAGEAKVGSRFAATIGKWSIHFIDEQMPIQYMVTLEITKRDTFWSTQGPVDVWLELGPRYFVWRIDDLTSTFKTPNQWRTV